MALVSLIYGRAHLLVEKVRVKCVKKEDVEFIIRLLNLVSAYQTTGRYAVRNWQYVSAIKTALRSNADLRQAFQSCLARINCNETRGEQDLLRIPIRAGNLFHASGKYEETRSQESIQCSSHKNEAE